MCNTKYLDQICDLVLFKDSSHASVGFQTFHVCHVRVQVEQSGDTEYNGYGFRSEQRVTGTFSHSFTTPSTYYYIAEGFGHIGRKCLISKTYSQDWIVSTRLLNQSVFVEYIPCMSFLNPWCLVQPTVNMSIPLSEW